MEDPVSLSSFGLAYSTCIVCLIAGNCTSLIYSAAIASSFEIKLSMLVCFTLARLTLFYNGAFSWRAIV